jgi:hypothetical protein
LQDAHFTGAAEDLVACVALELFLLSVTGPSADSHVGTPGKVLGNEERLCMRCAQESSAVFAGRNFSFRHPCDVAWTDDRDRS